MTEQGGTARRDATDETPGQKAVREHAKEELKLRRRQQFDWDVRGMLAILCVLGAFALAFAQLLVVALRATSPVEVLKSAAEIPAWAAAVVAGVTGFYFGSRGGGNGKEHRH